MSDYLPLEIQREIIQRLPVRSLIQFRSVSKAWKTLIDSPQFIAAYSASHSHPHHLLIRYEHVVVVDGQYVTILDDDKYVSIVDDDTFPQQKFAPTIPLSIKLLHHSRVVGCSGGLLCLYGYYPHPDIPDHPEREKQRVVLWNPSIRKSVAFDVPNVNYGSHETVLGFGVCPVTNDPKIVKIARDLFESESNNKVPWKVDVYTLASGEWRTPSCNLPSQSVHFTWEQVVIDKFIYWLAFDNESRTSYTIMSFDTTTDEFREVYLPEYLAHGTYTEETIYMDEMTISKVQESLVVLKSGIDADKVICVGWMMEYGVPKLFTKLFTIKTPHASIQTLGFTKSGELIMKTLDDPDNEDEEPALVVYEPYSKHVSDLGIPGRGCLFSANSYMETLLLLNE